MIKHIFETRTGRVVATVAAGVAVIGASVGAAQMASAHDNGGRGWAFGHSQSQSLNRLTATSAPVISGLGNIGAVLTVSTPGVWSQTPDSVTYQWFAGEHPISGATASTFTITADQAGRHIYVVEKAVKTGYVARGAHSNSISVAPLNRFEELQDVTISGDRTVGSVLTVSAGIYTPAPSSISYQWKRNGVAIDGAIGTSYTLTADDLGKQIRVVETVSADGIKTKAESSNRLWIPAS